MSKLYFRYGAMNSGKSTALLQAAHNYEERGQRVLLAKPGIDVKGDRSIVSRLGVVREVDFVIEPDADVHAIFERERARVRAESAEGAEEGAGERNGVGAGDAAAGPGSMSDTGDDRIACLLIDEAQFLTPAQVDDLLRIAVIEEVPVLAYGIRTDFQTVAFPGSRRLLEIAHSLEELKTICRCGRKALFNGRTIDGEFVFDGDQVAIEVGEVVYESLCAACYLQESEGLLAGDWHPQGEYLE